MPDSPQDVHKKLLGRKGEKLAVAYVKKQGMRVLKTNYRTPFGEADIIAKDGDETVFVEVKARETDAYGTPREAVGNEKQRRYYQIALCYGGQEGEEPNARFDVAEVYENGNVEHYKNAF